jgi:hypothetical protein
MHYMLHTQSRDNTPQFFSFAKELFGEKVEVQQCCNHLSGTNLFKNIKKFIQFIQKFVQTEIYSVFGLSAIGWRKDRSASISIKKITTSPSCPGK